ncbi:MAG: hypothetical protein J6S04_05260 [Clostridia bacterium]|nr:hypothetical protein [Clostridia bacterium]
MSVSKSQAVAIVSLASVSIVVCVVFLVFVYFRNRKIKMEDFSNYHIQVSDFWKSATAMAKGIDNSTDDEGIILNIKYLIKETLEPLYNVIPFKITSGYRSPALNVAVGSKSKTSQHLKGEASDLTTGTIEGNKRLYAYIRANLPFDQLIAEYGYKTIHVSLKRIGINRKQTLYTDDLVHYKTI